MQDQVVSGKSPVRQIELELLLSDQPDPVRIILPEDQAVFPGRKEPVLSGDQDDTVSGFLITVRKRFSGDNRSA